MDPGSQVKEDTRRARGFSGDADVQHVPRALPHHVSVHPPPSSDGRPAADSPSFASSFRLRTPLPLRQHIDGDGSRPGLVRDVVDLRHRGGGGPRAVGGSAGARGGGGAGVGREEGSSNGGYHMGLERGDLQDMPPMGHVGGAGGGAGGAGHDVLTWSKGMAGIRVFDTTSPFPTSPTSRLCPWLPLGRRWTVSQVVLAVMAVSIVLVLLAMIALALFNVRVTDVFIHTHTQLPLVSHGGLHGGWVAPSTLNGRMRPIPSSVKGTQCDCGYCYKGGRVRLGGITHQADVTLSWRSPDNYAEYSVVANPCGSLHGFGAQVDRPSRLGDHGSPAIKPQVRPKHSDHTVFASHKSHPPLSSCDPSSSAVCLCNGEVNRCWSTANSASTVSTMIHASLLVQHFEEHRVKCDAKHLKPLRAHVPRGKQTNDSPVPGAQTGGNAVEPAEPWLADADPTSEFWNAVERGCGGAEECAHGQRKQRGKGSVPWATRVFYACGSATDSAQAAPRLLYVHPYDTRPVVVAALSTADPGWSQVCLDRCTACLLWLLPASVCEVH